MRISQITTVGFASLSLALILGQLRSKALELDTPNPPGSLAKSGAVGQVSTALEAPAKSTTSNRILRYNPVQNPAISEEAAKRYYDQRERNIITFWGSDIIEDNILTLKTSSNISQVVSALSLVSDFEIRRALPRVRKLLDHSEISVQRAAAATLCSFGEKQGFDFLMTKRASEGFSEHWHEPLRRQLLAAERTDYNEVLIKLMVERNRVNPGNVGAFQISQLLAELGEVASLDLLIPFMERGELDESLLRYRKLKDQRLVLIARNRMENGSSEQIKAAATVLLAAQGDAKAQQIVADIVGRLAELPKQTVRPDHIGQPDASTDPVAYSILKEGIEVVPAEISVPPLKKIGLMSKNPAYVEVAIQQLGKVGTEAARNALLEIAQSLEVNVRGFEETKRTPTGMALLLFNDDESLLQARKMLVGMEREFEGYKLVAEAKGWTGVFGRFLRF